MSVFPLTLVIGGARSGKSGMAERLVTALPGPWTYIATAQAFDAEMRDRIAHHRADRAEGWVTLEEPLDLAGALRQAEVAGRPTLVDCLTLWLSNQILADADLDHARAELMALLPALTVPLVLVGNEVGLGIVPDNALARRFRDQAGLLHQEIARIAGRVILMAAGLPLLLKGNLDG